MSPLARIEHLANKGLQISITVNPKGDFVVSILKAGPSSIEIFTGLGWTVSDALDAAYKALKPFRGASPALGQGNGKGMGDASPEGGDA